jgi:hypothetical protein
MASLVFVGYCGMSIPIVEGELADLRREAAEFIRRKRRRGREVITLHGGKEWEFPTPDDAVMVSDWDGYLLLDKDGPPKKTYRCWECGFDVEEGECCDCMDYDPGPEEEEEDEDDECEDETLSCPECETPNQFGELCERCRREE